jgi:large conductance mechanosensitive channel
MLGQTGQLISPKGVSMLKGFRDFILRGNVVDLAVAVVIGAAFTAIVNALVADIINPLIAAIVSKPDFSFLILHVHGGAIKYGDFLNALISFLIIAATIYFLVVLPVNTLLNKFRPKVVAAPTTKPCPQCLSEIPIAATRCSHCTQLVA